jgi:GNAT superfamily N-acetyltransferase
VSAAPIDLRRLGAEDAAAYREIRLEALADSPHAFSSTLESEQDQPLDRFAARLADDFVLGAFVGARLVGVAGFYIQPRPKHRHKGMLWGMYVRPSYRAAGIGRKLVEAIIALPGSTSNCCNCLSSPTTCRRGGSTQASDLSNTASSATPQSIMANTMTTC